MIEQWRQTYYQYLRHLGVPEDKLEGLFDQRSQELISHWNMMDRGELNQLYSSFSNFLRCQMDYYCRINENYLRDSRKKPVKVIKSNGGRYWA